MSKQKHKPLKKERRPVDGSPFPRLNVCYVIGEDFFTNCFDAAKLAYFLTKQKLKINFCLSCCLTCRCDGAQSYAKVVFATENPIVVGRRSLSAACASEACLSDVEVPLCRALCRQLVDVGSSHELGVGVGQGGGAHRL